MESKEHVIQQIMERCKSRFDNIIGKALDGIEQDLRNAYNEGHLFCEEENSLYIEMRERKAFENGYKKGLEKNGLYGESIFDRDYKVGDEVIADNGTACFVITSLNGNDIGGIDKNGDTYAYMPSEICYKTGRHFNVCGLLNDIRIGGNDS